MTREISKIGLATCICWLAGFTGPAIAQDVLPPQEKKAEPAKSVEQTAPKQVGEPESLTEKASYLIGYNIVKDFETQLVDVDIEQLIRGIRQAAADQKTNMSDEEIRSVMQAFERKVIREREQRLAKMADENQRKGEAFLQANALKEGVKELEGGLQYLVLKQVSGPGPELNDRVKLHIKGSYIDGTEFESTTDGEPVEYKVAFGLRGVTQALQRMKVGSKWRVFIPGNLAYGIQGNPPTVGPNQTLIYELELVDIIK